jgi:hypothetical protein
MNDPLTNLELNLDLLLVVGLSGGLDRDRVYSISNSMDEDIYVGGP